MRRITVGQQVGSKPVVAEEAHATIGLKSLATTEFPPGQLLKG